MQDVLVYKNLKTPSTLHFFSFVNFRRDLSLTREKSEE